MFFFLKCRKWQIILKIIRCRSLIFPTTKWHVSLNLKLTLINKKTLTNKIKIEKLLSLNKATSNTSVKIIKWRLRNLNNIYLFLDFILWTTCSDNSNAILMSCNPQCLYDLAFFYTNLHWLCRKCKFHL